MTLLRLAVALVTLLTVGAVAAQEASTPAALCENALPAAEPETREFTQAEQVLEAGVDYRAILCTGAGPVYVDLFENLTPLTVNNFVFLAQQGYYNNTTFHRVIQDFMVQGGDPTGTGSGSPGYQFPDEFVGFLTFDQPGWLAMANANQPEQGILGTNGSQFFITTVPTPHLDFRHTIFGEVLEGQDNVGAIEIRDPATATTPGTSLDTVLIITDPTTVDADVAVVEPATQDEVTAAFNQLTELMPPGAEYTVTTITTEEAISGAPAELQEQVGALLNDNSHAYRISGAVTNCDLNTLPFMEVRYTLDAFATPAAAAAALADPVLGELAAADGLTETAAPENLTSGMYSTTTTACETDATRARTHWQRGRYLITSDATIPVDSPVPVELWLSDIVGARLFEPYFGDVLRREIRAS